VKRMYCANLTQYSPLHRGECKWYSDVFYVYLSARHKIPSFMYESDFINKLLKFGLKIKRRINVTVDITPINDRMVPLLHTYRRNGFMVNIVLNTDELENNKIINKVKTVQPDFVVCSLMNVNKFFHLIFNLDIIDFFPARVKLTLLLDRRNYKDFLDFVQKFETSNNCTANTKKSFDNRLYIYVDLARNIKSPNLIRAQDLRICFCRFKDMVNSLEKNTHIVMTPYPSDPLWRIVDYELGIFWPDKTNKIIAGCKAYRKYIHIDENGDIYPCGDLPLLLGNINDADLNQVLTKSSFMSFHDKCNECRIKYHCRGCLAASFRYLGDILKRDPQCWWVY